MELDLGLLLWIIFSASFPLGNDHFVNPPDLSSQTASLSSYPVYAVGDILDVSWVTAAGVVDLVINQLYSPVTEIDRTPNSAALTAPIHLKIKRRLVFVSVSRHLPDSPPLQHNKQLHICYTLTPGSMYNCDNQGLHYRRKMLWWAARPPRSSLNWFRACVLTILLCSLGYCLSTQRHARLRASFPTSQSANSHHAADLDYSTTSDSCPVSTSAQRIVVSIKTGATEAASKTPTQMQTTLRCVKNVFLFSDLEQDIGEYHLHDALNTVSPSIINNNSDFKFYNKQKELWQSKQNIDILRGAKNPEKQEELAAWTLDKYKNIHVLEKTWAMKPDMDWYLFIDADTYLLWPNLVRWLDTLNPKKKSYFGSEVNIDGTRFAHGGSGIILSRAIMYEIAVIQNGTAAAWDLKTKERCCGDLVLSLVLQEHGTELQDVWPLMSGETYLTMPFGPATPEYWCRPAISMHHLSPADMKELSDFEGRRSKTSDPLTHAELFKDLLLNSIPLQQENWDNLASDRGEFGRTGGVSSETATFEECGQACEADPNCFQYSHHGNTCQIGMSVRLGYKREADSEGVWRSGWHKARLADWVSKQPACDEITFPTQGA